LIIELLIHLPPGSIQSNSRNNPTLPPSSRAYDHQWRKCSFRKRPGIHGPNTGSCHYDMLPNRKPLRAPTVLLLHPPPASTEGSSSSPRSCNVPPAACGLPHHLNPVVTINNGGAKASKWRPIPVAATG
jgi:hypothetical protein